MTDLHDDGAIQNGIDSLEGQRRINFENIEMPKLTFGDCCGIVDLKWVEEQYRRQKKKLGPYFYLN